jgi:hypothetical protein
VTPQLQLGSDRLGAQVGEQVRVTDLQPDVTSLAGQDAPQDDAALLGELLLVERELQAALGEVGKLVLQATGEPVHPGQHPAPRASA